MLAQNPGRLRIQCKQSDMLRSSKCHRPLVSLLTQWSTGTEWVWGKKHQESPKNWIKWDNHSTRTRVFCKCSIKPKPVNDGLGHSVATWSSQGPRSSHWQVQWGAAVRNAQTMPSVASPNLVKGDVFSYSSNLQKDRKAAINLQHHYFSRDLLFYFLGGLLYTERR